MLQPEQLPSRSSSAPPRPTTRWPRASSATPTGTTKLPDFTEDPFRDYRYEDPFNIADPFAEDALTFDDTKNANAPSNNLKQLDPFGLETTRQPDDNESFAHAGFESDFSKTFPLAKKTPEKKKFDDFANFNDTNSNVKYDSDFSDAFASKPTTARSINIAEAFTIKSEKNKKSGLDLSAVFKEKLSFGERKNKSNNSNRSVWKNGNNSGRERLSEAEQIAWAEQQSIAAEKERQRIREQEEADLALALELSKHEKVSIKGSGGK